MKGLIIGVVVIAFIVGVFVFFSNDSPDLAPKTAGKSTKLSNTFVGAPTNSLTANQFAFMVDATNSQKNMPASAFLLITADKINSRNEGAFFDTITKRENIFERRFYE